MDWDTWTKLYKRLLATYNKTLNGEQMGAYYEALSQFPASLVDQAIAKTIADHKTWPSVAELCERCRSIISATPYKPSDCDVCHGNLWVDTEPHYEYGLTYAQVRRCPQCYAGKAA